MDSDVSSSAPNPIRDLLTLAVEHHIPTQCVFKLDALDGSGIPRQVIERFRDEGFLPLFFQPGDLSFDTRMRIVFTPTHVEMRLSFDALYACRIPWRAFHFLGYHLTGAVADVVAPPPEPTRGPPGLRLVDEDEGG